MEDSVHTLDYGEGTFRFPYRGLLRSLTLAETEELRASITRHDRVLQPVHIRPNGDVIDGDNRLHVARTVGLPLSKITLIEHDVDEEQGAALCLDMNAARRQMSHKEWAALRDKRRQEARAKRAQGKTVRQIASETGCSKTTAHRDADNGPSVPHGTEGPLSPAETAAAAMVKEGKPVRATAKATGLSRKKVRGIAAKVEGEGKKPRQRGRPPGGKTAAEQLRQEAAEQLKKAEEEGALEVPGAAAKPKRERWREAYLHLDLRASEPESFVRWHRRRIADKKIKPEHLSAWSEALIAYGQELAAMKPETHEEQACH